MSKFDRVYEVCLNNKNINGLIDAIRGKIKLSEKSIPTCGKMIVDIMKKKIELLSRPPRNTDELRDIAKYLNQKCIDDMIERIAKKYPDLYINQNKQISKEQMRRNLDTFGERANHVHQRPHSNTRKTPTDDEVFYNMQPNDTGTPGSDGSGSYASAFGNHMITDVRAGDKQQPFNNPHSQRDGSMEQRYQQYMNTRNDMGQRQKPETPDFSLDGSGEKVKQEKLKRKMEQESMSRMGVAGGMQNDMLNGMPMGMMMGGMMGEMMGDNPYAALLGGGAPNLPSNLPSNSQSNLPSMGMGNPLFPMSSTNMMADQMGFNGSSQTVKSMQLSSDYERKMAERHAIDVETGQPAHSGSSSMYGMQNVPSGGMNGGGIQGFQMPFQGITQGMSQGVPQMPSFQMPQMQSQGMSQNMPQLPNFQMPQMPQNLPQNLPQMPNFQLPNFQMPQMPNFQIPVQ